MHFWRRRQNKRPRSSLVRMEDGTDRRRLAARSESGICQAVLPGTVTPLGKVKVVILGQDPYHNVHQAHGLCFSVPEDQREIPPSLINIYRELHDDVGCRMPQTGCLTKWAEQGVLLLNTVLTVRAHQANSHRNHGWEQFTDAIIRAVETQDRPIVYMLWGTPAQSKAPMVTNPKHLVLKAPHPSPLSAYRGFFGCRHFSQCNEFLKTHGETPVDWQL